ncbi:hypothetical protein RA276_29070, partial [Pseudomonas syringae pv. tagetis]|uniref:hypothetical protein n=1 Tax=Pseudomonas syringae group genomosp. 7 TaxID=251699 RepID=UPI0037707394
MDEQVTATKHVIQGFNTATLYGKGFNLGSADLIQGGSLREVVGRCVSALLLHLMDKDGRRIFKGATIILPPITIAKNKAESV